MGLVFDIEEFAVFDGPGIRSVVFLKGCPLRCVWCHNPEGLSPRPQQVKTLSLCMNCGLCETLCPDPNDCNACGDCVRACPAGCLRIAGSWMDAQQVANKIQRQERILRGSGGGVTFSGGEALMQPDFVLAVREKLPSLHACIETSGYAPREDFLRVVKAMDLVIMDLKLMDDKLHRQYTGASNRLILSNLSALISLGKPFRIRVPLIPTISDTRENLAAIAERLVGASALEKVELMPYNQAAGAKYAGLGKAYHVSFPEQMQPQTHLDIFKEANIPCDVL